MLGTITIVLNACQQNKSQDSHPKVNTKKNEIKIDSNKIVLAKLDKVLSPFEDMTEFALKKDNQGILKSLGKIEIATEELAFSNNFSFESLKLLNPKLESLKKLIKQKDYEQIALVTADIFEFNVNNFIDSKKIESQIKIEHLDYMGFKVLALLNQEKINWQQIKETITKVQKEWIVLSPKVKDKNLKDSFDLLFNALYQSTKNRDVKMSELLSSMDLSLVDVLEGSL